MNEDFIERFKEIISLEGVKYFYHVTNVDPEVILFDGLYLVGDSIYETAIEIPEEFKNDPVNYSLNERGKFYRNNANIIIIGIEDDKIDSLLTPTTNIPNSWNLDIAPKNYISRKYIVGYIDTNTMELRENEDYDLAFELYNL